MHPLPATDDNDDFVPMTPEETKRLYLANFGLAYDSAGLLILSNRAKAETCHIHHTHYPLAALGWSAVAPDIARRRLQLPKYDLEYLFDRARNMDEPSLELVLTLTGNPAIVPVHTAEYFDVALRSIISRHQLQGYFGAYEGKLHYAIRPRGYAHDARPSHELPEELAAWRTNFQAESEQRQILIYSILSLYRGGIPDDDLWMNGIPHNWNGAEAIATLRRTGLLPDWGMLIALYPGW